MDCIEYADRLEEWPNCSVSDCEYKACLSLNTGMCYGHSLNLPIIPFEEYMQITPRDE